MKKTILIAESDNSFRSILSEKLEQAGYTVILVSSGAAVVSTILEEKPGLVLLALDIAERDGLEIMLDLKTRDETRDTSVVVISQSGDPMEIEKAREIGADDFLIRAIFDPDEVLEKIDAAFNVPIDPSVHKTTNNDAEARDLDDVLASADIPQSPEIVVDVPDEVESPVEATAEGKNGKVMIIEDDKFLREDLYGRKLRNAGFEVESAEDGERAFKMLSMMMPDIIILDLVLPGMDGFEILQKIRSTERTKDIPVIIVSNLGQQEDIDKAMNLGATDFMVKANFTLDEIASRINSIINPK